MANADRAVADPGPVSPEHPAVGQQPAFERQTKAPLPETPSSYGLTVLASGLERPWGLGFLPEGRMLVSERPGRLRIVGADGQVSAPVAGVPEVRASGTSGLLDIAMDPQFAANSLVYFTYMEPHGELSGAVVARARLDWRSEQPALHDLSVIFQAEPLSARDENGGSRLAFGRDGTLYITIGDRFASDEAQNLGSHLGKVIRIRPDGGIPSDNPFVGQPGARPEIYALGQRNAQGLAFEPESGALWEIENGAKGGDELNLVRPGANYGWPIITYGRGYDDAPIGVGTAKDGLEQPIYYWDPSIAPSGFTFYSSARAPHWRGNIFVASLKGQHVSRLVLEGGRVVAEEQLLGELHSRLRHIAEGPDGALYVLTDEENGRLVRVEPGQAPARVRRELRGSDDARPNPPGQSR